MTVPGLYIGALAVAALQFVRSRERRLVPLMALCALLAAAHVRDLPSREATILHLGAGIAALACVLVKR